MVVAIASMLGPLIGKSNQRTNGRTMGGLEGYNDSIGCTKSLRKITRGKLE